MQLVGHTGPVLTGVVREWHREAGWGVIDCDATPGGCWAFFSVMVWPPGVEPDTTTRTTMGPTPAYRSVLDVRLDDGATQGGTERDRTGTAAPHIDTGAAAQGR